jgi:hypothetical protein
MEPMWLPDGGSPDFPSNEELAQRANQPRNALSGNEVGILDPVCKSDGLAGGSVAGQMGWSQRGAHLLLQIRTLVLDEEWENTFRRWYPDFRPQGQAEKAA